MIRRNAVAVWLISFVVTIFCAGDAYSKEHKGDPAASFKKDYPSVVFESIEPAEIDGLYEVVAGNNIIYYHPKTGNVFFGEIITKRFVNITAEKRNSLVSAKLKGLPLDKAIRLGSGKNIIVEFTDIDCPFCRKLEEYFDKRDDVTRYVFLLPLESIHPKAVKKSLSVLCSGSEERAAAYKNAMKGLLDDKDVTPCIDGGAVTLLEEHKEFAVKLGVQGTPALWVNDTPVMGANISQIDQILSGRK
jgi:thiol:disulfide interchange protein DsbC